MTSKNKAKSAGVSASSFLDLKAELATKQTEISKNKAAGIATGSFEKLNKKPSVWRRTNKGVNARAARDVELEAVSRVTIDSGRAVLERKAKIYDKLRRGDYSNLTDKQREALMVDFDAKEDLYSSSEDEDLDESLTVPKPPGNDDDPEIEYLDDLGRTRKARRSEIPKELLPPNPEDDPIVEYQDHYGEMRRERRSLIPKDLLPAEEEEWDPDVMYNPVNHFPVYEPTEDRVAEIEKEFAEENNPLNLHYDASREVRAKGAGFYQFSGDEETRVQQMEELRRAREETDKVRQEAGAVDLRPGEVEGMRAEGSKSKALEKRKRDLEERRKLLAAKRRKVKCNEAEPTPITPPESKQSYTVAVQPSRPVASDPFAALEATSTGTNANVADSFLADLEREIQAGKGS